MIFTVKDLSKEERIEVPVEDVEEEIDKEPVSDEESIIEKEIVSPPSEEEKTPSTSPVEEEIRIPVEKKKQASPAKTLSIIVVIGLIIVIILGIIFMFKSRTIVTSAPKKARKVSKNKVSNAEVDSQVSRLAKQTKHLEDGKVLASTTRRRRR